MASARPRPRLCFAAFAASAALLLAPVSATAQVFFGGYGYRGFYAPGYPFFGYPGYYPAPFFVPRPYYPPPLYYAVPPPIYYAVPPPLRAPPTSPRRPIRHVARPPAPPSASVPPKQVYPSETF